MGKARRRERSGSVPRAPIALALALMALAWAGHANAATKEEAIVGWSLGVDPVFSVSPRAISRTAPAPVAVTLGGRVRPSEVPGAASPPLQELDVDLDRSIELDVRGLPRCPVHPLQHQGIAAYERNCRKAAVGRGTARIEVPLPEGGFERLPIPVRVYNAGEAGGAVTLAARLLLTAPAPAVVVVPIRIDPERDGRYGLHLAATFPEIAGGSGSVSSFQVTLGRRFSSDGERASVFSARCVDGELQAALAAQFADGTEAGTETVRPCIAAPRPPAGRS